MNTAGQCLITLSQTYGYLSKQLYSFLVSFIFNTSILPEDMYWNSKFPNFQSKGLHFTLIQFYTYFCSPTPFLASKKIFRDWMRVTFQRTAKCGIINYTLFFKIKQLRTGVHKQVILRTMRDKVPASSAKNMALPNLASDLGTAHNAGHVPESLQEPALCASCISMCQFGYYTQLQCPL